MKNDETKSPIDVSAGPVTGTFRVDLTLPSELEMALTLDAELDFEKVAEEVGLAPELIVPNVQIRPPGSSGEFAKLSFVWLSIRAETSKAATDFAFAILTAADPALVEAVPSFALVVEPV
jgi:hypothetical protein